MTDSSRNFDMNQLISISNDLVNVLQDPNDRDLNILSQCLQHTLSLSSTCQSDLNQVSSLFQGTYKVRSAYKVVEKDITEAPSNSNGKAWHNDVPLKIKGGSVENPRGCLWMESMNYGR
ncbi:hypothetical protein L195_g029118 [Trifolium pratense]|uniref:Uncharacterized protein n=1 Tax=Trifolium pratense TaxID=57577 RepID=A0A2K3L3X3_TRIPR|nr:hypothetical protein L195_g029118 [Trifolium pratense]